MALNSWSSCLSLLSTNEFSKRVPGAAGDWFCLNFVVLRWNWGLVHTRQVLHPCPKSPDSYWGILGRCSHTESHPSPLLGNSRQVLYHWLTLPNPSLGILGKQPTPELHILPSFLFWARGKWPGLALKALCYPRQPRVLDLCASVYWVGRILCVHYQTQLWSTKHQGFCPSGTYLLEGEDRQA